jgi:hypothetical protein
VREKPRDGTINALRRAGAMRWEPPSFHWPRLAPAHTPSSLIQLSATSSQRPDGRLTIVMHSVATRIVCAICVVAVTRFATASSGNPAHDLLITKSAAEQAAMLGKAVGNGCSGTTPFFMGITEDGSALWSVLCANGSSYVVNISPDPVGTTKALGCSRLQTMHLDCFSPLPEPLRRPAGNMPEKKPTTSDVPAGLPNPPTILRGGNGR